MKTKNKIILLMFCCAFISERGHADEYSNDQDSCTNYEVIKKNLNCTKNDYIDKFAAPYCEKYLDMTAQFSVPSQVILREIRWCLQDTLIQAPQLTCDDIETIGLDAHYACYIQSGFCSMPEKDKLLVIWTARSLIDNVPVINTFLRIEKHCLGSDIVPTPNIGQAATE